MAGLLAIALVVALGLFGFGKQAVAPAPAVIARKADMGGESSESGEIYLGDVNREFLPGHVVVLKKLMQVQIVRDAARSTLFTEQIFELGHARCCALCVAGFRLLAQPQRGHQDSHASGARRTRLRL